jgi:osmotically-inducible protein OsmY
MIKCSRGWQRALALIAVCGTAAISLQGCFGMMVGGAVVGTLAATDRRTLGAQADDKTIVFKSGNRIASIVGDDGYVNVNSFDHKVLLTGEVKDEAMKQAVEKEVLAVDSVQSVDNELAIDFPSSIASRSNDALITGEVKAAFVDSKALQANTIKVVTERGTVYLMGRVTEREGQIAAEVASGARGVNKVVKIFEYLTDDELRQLSNVS